MNEDSSEKCKGYLAITLNDLTPGLKVFFDEFSESFQFDTNFLCLIKCYGKTALKYLFDLVCIAF